jgi:serine/threonine-protein kinase
VRVALADDAVLFRQALAEAFAAAGLEVVGQAGDAAGIIAIAELERPEVVVMDVRMPPTFTTEGLDAALHLREVAPDVGVLVLSQYVETRHAMRLLQSGTDGIGYLLKERVGDLGELIAAVRRVGSGGSVIDPEVVGQLLGRPRPHGPLDELTPRERQVLELMAEGRSNQGIAEALVLDPKTVEGHVSQIFGKLGLERESQDNRRVLAVLEYLRVP